MSLSVFGLDRRFKGSSAGGLKAPRNVVSTRCQISNFLRSTVVLSATKMLLGPVAFIARKFFTLLHARFEVRPALVVFGSRAAREFSDNSMHLFRWCVDEEGLVINPVWMTRSRRVRNELRAAGLPVLLFPGLSALRALSTCATIVVSYRIADVCMLSAMMRRDLRVVHLGHGIPVKRFRASLPEFSSDSLFIDELRALNDRDAWFVSSSTFAAKFVAEANMAPVDRCPALGLPRNDSLVVRERSIRDVDPETRPKRILLAPTWRKGQASAQCLPAWIDDDRLLDALTRAGVELWIRLHPKASAFERSRLSSLQGRGWGFFELPPSEYPDVNTELTRFDALISDYSSIVADFMLLNRPIGIVVEPVGEAQRERDEQLYYPELVAQNLPQLRGLEDVLAFVNQVSRGSFPIQYDPLRGLLHEHSGSACERVALHFGFVPMVPEDLV